MNNEELEKCITCLQELKPDLESKRYLSDEWDEHTYFPCKCMGDVPEGLRISIG